MQRLAVAIGCRAYLQATLGAHVSQGCPVPSRAAEHICRLLRETRMEVVTHDPTRENTQPLTRTQTHTHTHIHRHTHTDTHTHTHSLSHTFQAAIVGVPSIFAGSSSRVLGYGSSCDLRPVLRCGRSVCQFSKRKWLPAAATTLLRFSRPADFSQKAGGPSPIDLPPPLPGVGGRGGVLFSSETQN